MDSTQPQAATSSSSPLPAHTEDPSQPGSSEPKVLRTSARVKAAKQKEKHNQRTQQDPSQSAASSSSKRTRDNKGKGREAADEARASNGMSRGMQFHVHSLFPVRCRSTRRATLSATSTLTINETSKDVKGPKRAAPEDHSDDDKTAATPSSAKKPHRATSAYSLRPGENIKEHQILLGRRGA